MDELSNRLNLPEDKEYTEQDHSMSDINIHGDPPTKSKYKDNQLYPNRVERIDVTRSTPIDISSGNAALDRLMIEIQRSGNIQDLLVIIYKIDNEIQQRRNKVYKFITPEAFLLVEIIKDLFYGEDDPDLVTPESFKKLYKQLDWRKLDIAFCMVLYWLMIVFCATPIFCILSFVKLNWWQFVIPILGLMVVGVTAFAFLPKILGIKSINTRILWFIGSTIAVTFLGAGFISVLFTPLISSDTLQAVLTMLVLLGIGVGFGFAYSNRSDAIINTISFVPTYNTICDLIQRRVDSQVEYITKTYEIPEQIKLRQQEAEKNKIFANISADERREMEELELENAIYLQQIRETLAIAQATSDEQVKEIKENLRLQALKNDMALKYKYEDLERLDQIDARKRGHELLIVRVKAMAEILKEQARILADDSQERAKIDYQLSLLKGIQGDLSSSNFYQSNSLHEAFEKLTEIMTNPSPPHDVNPPSTGGDVSPNPSGSNSPSSSPASNTESVDNSSPEFNVVSTVSPSVPTNSSHPNSSLPQTEEDMGAAIQSMATMMTNPIITTNHNSVSQGENS